MRQDKDEDNDNDNDNKDKDKHNITQHNTALQDNTSQATPNQTKPRQK